MKGTRRQDSRIFLNCCTGSQRRICKSTLPANRFIHNWVWKERLWRPCSKKPRLPKKARTKCASVDKHCDFNSIGARLPVYRKCLVRADLWSKLQARCPSVCAFCLVSGWARCRADLPTLRRSGCASHVRWRRKRQLPAVATVGLAIEGLPSYHAERGPPTGPNSECDSDLRRPSRRCLHWRKVSDPVQRALREQPVEDVSRFEAFTAS